MNIESIDPLDEYRLQMTRRHFFSRCGLGLGTSALAALLKEDGLAAGTPEGSAIQSGGLPDLSHFAPKARRVIYLFQSGGPSQLELFDHKPQLEKYRGQDLPDSVARAAADGNDGLSIQLPHGTFDLQIRSIREIWRHPERVAAAHGKDCG